MADEKKEKRKLWRPVRSEEMQKEEELKTAKEAKKQEEPQISAQTRNFNTPKPEKPLWAYFFASKYTLYLAYYRTIWYTSIITNTISWEV